MEFTHLVQQSISLFAPLKKELAYLDPGTGSFLLQLLLATSLGALFLVKTFWKRIRDFFRRLFTGKKAEADHPETVQTDAEPPHDEQP